MNSAKPYSILNQDKWEYVPPCGPVLLIDPTSMSVTGGFKYAHVDNLSIKGYRASQLEHESNSIYYEYAKENASFLMEDYNAYIGCWMGDHKLYLAVCYAYEDAPSHMEVNSSSFTLHDTTSGKIKGCDASIY